MCIRDRVIEELPPNATIDSTPASLIEPATHSTIGRPDNRSDALSCPMRVDLPPQRIAPVGVIPPLVLLKGRAALGIEHSVRPHQVPQWLVLSGADPTATPKTRDWSREST